MKSLLILTSEGCHKCPEVLSYVHKMEGPYNKTFLPSNHPDFMANVEAHQATKAPTVILFGEKKKDGSMDELGRAHDVEELKELLTKYEDE